MAKVSFDTAAATFNNEGSNNSNSVGFFSLKNDGDEAVVRIMHDSVEDFDLLMTHPITLGGKYRSISCIRDPREPVDKCPLCKAGTKVQSKIFIHMIQYVTTENGKIEAKPVVWERSFAYATKLKNDIAEYGPLSNCIFKIRRNGKAGDMQTTYDMRLGNPNMYNESAYPKLPDAFKGYSALGTVVLDKTFDEIVTFNATGNFPERKSENTSEKVDVPQNVAPQFNSYNPTSESAVAVNTQRGSWEGVSSVAPSEAPARPTRFY